MPARTICSSTGRPIRSAVISRWRSSAAAERRAVEADDEVLGVQPGARGGPVLDDLDHLEPVAPAEPRGDPRRQRPRADRDAEQRAAHAAVAHQRGDDQARRVVDRHGEAEPDAGDGGVDPDDRPLPSTSAPPELPGLSAASVCTTFSTRRCGPPRRPTGSERPSAETTPAVTDPA